jgi:hypothetical protein
LIERIDHKENRIL